MARPPKRSPERETAILNSLRVGNTRRASCAAAEVSVDSLARWMADDAVFCGEVIKAEADAELRFLGQVAKAATTTWQAAAWWLERRKPQDYRRMDGVELSGPDGGPIETRSITATMTEKEKAQLADAIDAWLKDHKVDADA